MKKTARVLAALTAVVMASSAMAFSASAEAQIETRSNTSDTYFAFNFHFLTGKAETGDRVKQDATSTYLNSWTIPTEGYSVYVDGRINGEWKDCTLRQPYVDATGEGYIQQMVYENAGYVTVPARLGAWRQRGTGNATGVWSPDSIGSGREW